MRARRTAPSLTSALGLSRHRGGCLPSALYPLAVVLSRSVGSAAVGFSCGSKNYRRHECAQVQRQLNRSAGTPIELDRKSTRLNSSHQIISYAVFCLKKKKIGAYPYAFGVAAADAVHVVLH